MKLNNIKNKFDDREIQPSADSWDRLSERLSTIEKKKKQPVVLWLSGIAAILILGLLAAPAILFNDTIDPTGSEIVIEETSTQQKDLDLEAMEPVPVIKEQPQDAVAITDKDAAVTDEVKAKRVPLESKKLPIQPKKVTDIASIERKDEIIEQNAIAASTTDFNTQETVEQEDTSSLNEVDQLLDNAMKKIARKKQINNSVAAISSSSVNPQKLLRETEWDIEAQNRNKLENTLLDGLGRLKREAVALIDRNQ
ncbi:hypothetical protein AAU57_05355 [Nonlabens sp. YIK11]|uniref:hypothetical protein n=1 Tax=Nonlabens sp. YIK11 TaxID=1453349 RepID=UPI0006DC772F|nr:hypothetical protein [Nonlabens sp. YIK11]KQC32802.1 hypothetical protein AAU57_05355 [Nonlabens sp. YIK11]